MYLRFEGADIKRFRGNNVLLVASKDLVYQSWLNLVSISHQNIASNISSVSKKCKTVIKVLEFI
jgi:hypothetical protein